jgi:hypothetical protein
VSTPKTPLPDAVPEIPGHVHGPDCNHDHDHEPLAPYRRAAPKLGRNDPCFCGSGRKFKKCHGADG